MSSPRSYTVRVPTKTYLRKYIYAEYGHPLKLDYHTPLGTLILCLLENEDFSINMNNEKKESRIQYMNDQIEFSGPLSTMRYKGYSLTKDRVIAINRYVENEFIKDLHYHCKTNLKNRMWRPGIKDAIFSFADIYKIEVEIDVTFEALKKAEARYRDRKEKKTQNISQTFVPQKNNPLQNLFFPSVQLA